MVLARTTLWYIVFCGFAINYVIRLNITIAIVGMIKPQQFWTTKNTTDLQLERLNATTINDLKTSQNQFEWDETAQNQVLGAFFWFHWVTQVPGGILARKYGTKTVFGLSNLCISLMAYLIPFCAHWGLGALVTLRVLQGLVSGLAWPSMHHMTAIWIPQDERSKFVSAYLGSSFGAALTYPVCGFIMDKLNWEWVFHITASMGVIWYIIWFFFVYDTPAKHPTISAKEREYILTSNGGMIHQKNTLPVVPWREICTSRPVLMNVIGQFGGIWGLFTLITQAPTYLKSIHGINIKMNGIYSGLPHLCRWGFSHVFAIFCDKLLRSDNFSKTQVRKIATTFSTIIQGILILGIAYSGHNTFFAVFFLVTATMVNGAVSSGPLASLVDLSPNFASVLQGISGMISTLPGFISPAVVAYYTLNNQTAEQWKKVFILASVVIIVSGILYDIFATSELQPWNEGLKPKENGIEKMNIIKPRDKSKIVRQGETEKKSGKNEREADRF